MFANIGKVCLKSEVLSPKSEYQLGITNYELRIILAQFVISNF